MVIHIGRCRSCGEVTMLGWTLKCDRCTTFPVTSYSYERNPQTGEMEGVIRENGKWIN